MVLSGTDWVPGVGARAPVYNAVCSVQRTTESFFSQKVSSADLAQCVPPLIYKGFLLLAG